MLDTQTRGAILKFEATETNKNLTTMSKMSDKNERFCVSCIAKGVAGVSDRCARVLSWQRSSGSFFTRCACAVATTVAKQG